MITPWDVFNRLRQDFHRGRYQRLVANVVSTPPLERGSLPCIVLSMVHKRDVMSYLVAIKSFAFYANPVRVVIICDPSIEPSDRLLFRQHLPHVELRDAIEFRHPGIPTGGCWERLHALSEYAASSYVIQLDADTVTTNSPDTVINAVASQTGFVLGERVGQTLLTLPQTAALYDNPRIFRRHVQCAFEAAIEHAGLPTGAQYVRGCAGFTGFPKSDTLVADLLQFAAALRRSLGDRWADWGTEQAASNYLVANVPGTRLLPFPEYGTPDVMNPRSELVHFIGSMRFTSGRYLYATRQALRKQVISKTATPSFALAAHDVQIKDLHTL